MIDILCAADFMQCDIMYDECTDYRSQQNCNGTDGIRTYATTLKKIFLKRFCRNSSFVVEETLTLVASLTDWSDAEIKGLQLAVGTKTLEKNY